MSNISFNGDARKRILFGDGRDGSIAYSADNNRWEDGDGNALANESRWTGVATTTLTILQGCQFINVTVPVGATLQLGADLGYGLVPLRVCGVLSVSGTITAGIAGQPTPTVTARLPFGGAAKTTAGAGNNSGSSLGMITHGIPGAAGGGGGDGTNVGGSRSIISSVGVQALIPTMLIVQGSSVGGTGTTGLGGDGSAPPSMAGNISQFDSPWMSWPSSWGFGGSGGALKQAGGANAGGAGGDWRSWQMPPSDFLRQVDPGRDCSDPKQRRIRVKRR